MTIKKLYERDFLAWTEEVSKSISNKDFADMDWENLIEEIEDMGKSEKRSLESYLERLIEHILKIKYWHNEHERNYRHWKAKIVNFRKRINRLLKRSTSLKNYLVNIYPEIFNDSVEVQKNIFDIPDDNFVELKTIMNQDYFG